MPAALQPRDGGSDDALLLVAQRAILAGMRVEPADGEAGSAQAPFGREIASDNGSLS